MQKREEIKENLPLTDLAWLNALEFVGGDLTIENNANDLDTLEALDNLLYIGGKLIVRENWLLDSVDEIMHRYIAAGAAGDGRRRPQTRRRDTDGGLTRSPTPSGARRAPGRGRRA